MDQIVSDPMVQGYVGKAAVFAAFAVATWYFSTVLDKRAGIKFPEVWNAISQDPRAAARYLGMRWLGLCILGAAAVFFS